MGVTLRRIKQNLYKLGMEMAAAETWRKPLDPSAAGRVMCWTATWPEVLRGGALPGAPQHPGSAWGEGGGQVLPAPIQPSGFDVPDTSLKLPSVAQTLPRCQHRLAAPASPRPDWGGPCVPLLRQVPSPSCPAAPWSHAAMPRRRDGARSPAQPHAPGRAEGRVHDQGAAGSRGAARGEGSCPPARMARPSPRQAPSSPRVFLEAKCCLIVKRQKVAAGGEAGRQR